MAIIGVVAALTIPTVVQNYREKQTVVAVKKAYSQLSQAFQMAQVNEGPIETWNWGSSGTVAAAISILSKISPYLKIIKNCGGGEGCAYNGYYKTLDGTAHVTKSYDASTSSAKAILGDGSFISIYPFNAGCNLSRGSDKASKNLCGEIWIDINGAKKPNQDGNDRFLIYFSKYGLVPCGLPTQIGGTYTFADFCDINKKSWKNGVACTAWILAKENMDYLKDTVSW